MYKRSIDRLSKAAQLATAGIALASLAAMTACAEAIDVRSHAGGQQAAVRDTGVSGGGFRLVPGETILFYGTALERGVRRYTYFVVGPRLATANRRSEMRSGKASIAGDVALADHYLALDGVKLSARFEAKIDSAKNALTAPKLEVAGKAYPGEFAQLFFFDWTKKGAQPQAITAKLEAAPSELDEIADAAKALATKLLRDNAELRKLVGK